jgi:hypothetical protein
MNNKRNRNIHKTYDTLNDDQVNYNISLDFIGIRRYREKD